MEVTRVIDSLGRAPPPKKKTSKLGPTSAKKLGKKTEEEASVSKRASQ